MQDWAADVRRYAPHADQDVIEAIIDHCGIALYSRDASLVSFADRDELDRVRERFLKRKLGLNAPDAVLDQAIAAVGDLMQGERNRNRVTVYYLLAERLGMLSIFGAGDREAATGETAFAADSLGVAASVVVADRESGGEPRRVRPDVLGLANPPAPGLGWLPWVMLAAALLVTGWWLITRDPRPEPAPSPAASEAAAPTLLPLPPLAPDAPAPGMGG